jgi:hypothetical protein
MSAGRIQYPNNLVVGVDIRLRTVPAAYQASGRNLGLGFDATQVSSKPAYCGQTSGLRPGLGMIGPQRELQREGSCNLPCPLCLEELDEALQPRFDSPKIEPQLPA